ncbi:hypothetical protein TI04_05985 [Achromatium sp. WMS2]|nr:hypothetical protein TI04_05985 [Achromatium sp. WMS2]
MLSRVEIYADGACKGNPGPGGWGVIIRIDGTDRELCGGDPYTTNNRMELMAVIKGLETLSAPSNVHIITDSKYVKEGMTKYIDKWISTGKLFSQKKSFKNYDLWERLYKLASAQQKVEWSWVRGHSGHPENERADWLANQGVSTIGKTVESTAMDNIDLSDFTSENSDLEHFNGIIDEQVHNKRQIVLDTETTGLSAEQGHRIIEIGAVELVNRRLTGNNFHHYLQPEREIDAGAIQVHGITREALADKPLFSSIAAELIDYLRGAELIMHNAQFDIGFLNAELKRWCDSIDKPAISITDICSVVDTLDMARREYPGQRNSLDILCKRYNIDNSKRTLHGALLDAELLANVYLAMTGGQTTLIWMSEGNVNNGTSNSSSKVKSRRENLSLPVIQANAEESSSHQQLLQRIDKKSSGKCLWLQ